MSSLFRGKKRTIRRMEERSRIMNLPYLKLTLNKMTLDYVACKQLEKMLCHRYLVVKKYNMLGGRSKRLRIQKFVFF